MKNKLLHALMLTSALSATFAFASDHEAGDESSASGSLLERSEHLDTITGDVSSSASSQAQAPLLIAQQEIARLTQELDASTFTIQQLQADHRQLDLDYVALDADFTEATQKLGDAQAEVQGLHKILAQLSQERDDLKRTNKKLAKAMKVLETQLLAQTSAVEVTPAKKQAEIVQPTSRRTKPAAASSTPADDAKDASSTNTELASGKPAEVVQPTSRRSRPAATSAVSTQQPIADLAESNDVKETQGEVSASASVKQNTLSEPAIIKGELTRDDKINEMTASLEAGRTRVSEVNRLKFSDERSFEKEYKKFKAVEAALKAAAAGSDEDDA